MLGAGLRAMLDRLRGDDTPVHRRHPQLVGQTACGKFLTQEDRWTESPAEVTCKRC